MATEQAPKTTEKPVNPLETNQKWFFVREQAIKNKVAANGSFAKAVAATAIEETGHFFFGDNTATAGTVAAGLAFPESPVLPAAVTFGGMKMLDAFPDRMNGPRRVAAEVVTSLVRVSALPFFLNQAGASKEIVGAAVGVSAAAEFFHQIRRTWEFGEIGDNFVTVITPPNQIRFATDFFADKIGGSIVDPKKVR